MITENAINDYSTLTRVESPLISPQNPIHVLPAGSCIERGRAPLFPHPALVLKVRARAEDSGALWVERRGRGGVESLFYSLLSTCGEVGRAVRVFAVLGCTFRPNNPTSLSSIFLTPKKSKLLRDTPSLIRSCLKTSIDILRT